MPQSPTIYPTAAGTANTAVRSVYTELGSNIPIQMDKELLLLDPNENPFTLLTTQVPKVKIADDTHKWQDDEIVPEHSQLSGASSAIAAAATGTWNVDQGEIFAAWDTVKNMNTGSWGQVVSVSTDALTVDAHVAISAGSTDDVILRLGNSIEEGGGLVTSKSTARTERTNYIQRISDPIRFTRMAKNADDYTEGMGGDYKLQHRKGLLQHARHIEYAFLFNGAPTLALPAGAITPPADTGSNYEGYMGGLEYWISTYSPAENVKLEADLTRSEFFSWMEPMFAYGSDTKYLFCAPSLLAALLEWNLGQIQFKPSTAKQTLGMNFAEVTLPFGPSRVKLINHKMLRCPVRTDGVPQAYDYAFCVDFSEEKIKYVYFNGLDTTVEKDVVKDGTHKQTDEIFTYCSNQFRLPECHGMLRWKSHS